MSYPDLVGRDQHACALLGVFGGLDFTAIQVDEVRVLARLLETPGFVSSRLDTIDPSRHAQLIKAYYGILMLLPQASSALPAGAQDGKPGSPAPAGASASEPADLLADAFKLVKVRLDHIAGIVTADHFTGGPVAPKQKSRSCFVKTSSSPADGRCTPEKPDSLDMPALLDHFNLVQHRCADVKLEAQRKVMSEVRE